MVFYLTMECTPVVRTCESYQRIVNSEDENWGLCAQPVASEYGSKIWLVNLRVGGIVCATVCGFPCYCETCNLEKNVV